MLTRKCLAVLLLVVATNFSQSFAAPSLENGNPDETISEGEASPPLQPAKEDVNPQTLVDTETLTSSTPLEDSQAKELQQEENFGIPSLGNGNLDETDSVSADNGALSLQPSAEDARPQRSDDAPIEDYPAQESEPEVGAGEPSSAAQTTGVPQNLLTREEEDEILKRIPDFAIIMKSFEELPVDVYANIREFLQRTLPKMPAQNIMTLHFQNAFLLTQLFDRVVRVAVAHGSDDPTVRKELFSKVHKVVPDIMEEMEVVNNFVGNVRAQVPSFGTSANPTDQYGGNSFASVQLPGAGAEESRGDERPTQEENVVSGAAADQQAVQNPEEFVEEFLPQSQAGEQE